MFVNTGSRKVKALTHVIFPYECNEPCYSTKKINILSFEIHLYLSMGHSEDFFDRMKRENEKFFNVMTKNQLFLLINKLKELNGVLLFSYDSPDKKKKTQRVNFYVVPKSAYGFSRLSPKLKNKPCKNERFFLVSDAMLPDEMVNGCRNEKMKGVKADDAVIHFDVKNTHSKG